MYTSLLRARIANKSQKTCILAVHYSAHWEFLKYVYHIFAYCLSQDFSNTGGYLFKHLIQDLFLFRCVVVAVFVVVVVVCCCCCCLVAQSCPALCKPMDGSLQGFPGKITGVGCHFLLQEIFPTQGSNLHLLFLLHCWQILYCLSHRGSLMRW